MTNDSVALEVDRLWVHLAGIPVLRGVSLRVGQGATVALVGPNGAGKTTTLRAIMGLVPATGDVRLGGHSLQDSAAHRRARRGLGYAPEDRRLIAALTVEDNLLLPARACGFGRQGARRRLARVLSLLPEVEALRGRWATTLSGGQQKMVTLARALMAGDQALLLDEPFQGLAPALARRYAEALVRLRASEPEIAILVTESNPALVESLAAHTYTLERGEIAAPA